MPEDQYPDYVETIELSDQDQKDLAELYSIDGGKLDDEAELPQFHPILEVWREVLKPAATERMQPPSSGWCNRIVSSFQEVEFADMYNFRDTYFDKIAQLAAIIDFEIGTDPDCLSYSSPEEDALENAEHYKSVLLLWQQAVQQWELEWSCVDIDAGVELAAISEVHKMFFGEVGLTQYLDNIRFEFTEADQATLAEALQDQRERFFELEAETGE